MALLPGERWVIQQNDGIVSLFKTDGSDEEIVRFDPADPDDTAKAQATIHFDSRLTDEEKCFAHMWSGYFLAYATMGHVYETDPNQASRAPWLDV